MHPALLASRIILKAAIATLARLGTFTIRFALELARTLSTAMLMPSLSKAEMAIVRALAWRISPVRRAISVKPRSTTIMRLNARLSAQFPATVATKQRMFLAMIPTAIARVGTSGSIRLAAAARSGTIALLTAGAARQTSPSTARTQIASKPVLYLRTAQTTR